MHLLSSTGPVTTCSGTPVETAAQRGVEASANVMVVDCIPCLRKALVAQMHKSDALAKELAALRAGLHEAAQRLHEAVGAMGGT